MKYRAFISYSHRDEKWGGWLHRRLETYRVPKAIVGSAGRDGALPDRLGKIFRDREELPTSADLGTMLIEALDASGYLVVICSPESASSQWVNEEILHFKRTGRENRILPIIIGGEPNATDKGRPDDECFPPALRVAISEEGELTEERVEPIAADARPGKDGRDNAFLKLVAGLLGTDYDALRQRELRRRKQRAARTWTAAAAIGIVVAGLSGAAVLQSQRANTAVAQSEQLREVAQNLKEKWTGEGSTVTPLIDAVLLGDTAKLDELAPTPEELNELWGSDQITPLMIACMIGDPDTVTWLLENGARTDIFNPHGDAAIHMIADTGQPGALEPLKLAGADLNLGSRQRGGKDWRLIDYAASNGSVEVVAELLRLGVPIEVVPTGTEYASPLFTAAWFGQTEVAQLLLDSGARTDITDQSSRTPYQTALEGGHPETAALLGASLGVSSDKVTNEALFNVVTMIAVGQMELSDAEELVREGADVNFVGEFGETTFAYAVNMCVISSVEQSLASQRPTTIALVKLMLEAGGDVNTTTASGMSLRQSLEMQNDTELLELLYGP